MSSPQVGHAPEGQDVACRKRNLCSLGRLRGPCASLPACASAPAGVDGPGQRASDAPGGIEAAVTGRAVVGAAEDPDGGRSEAVDDAGIGLTLRDQEFLAVQAVAPGLLLDKIESGSNPGIGKTEPIGVMRIGLPLAVIVRVIIDGHAGAIDGKNVIAYGINLLGKRGLPPLLA